MRPTVNSDESVTAHRSAHVGRYTDHLSRRPKEQISGSKNAQAEYETHLLQNAAHSSTYGPDNWPATSSERHANSTLTDRKDASNVPEILPEQKHKGVGTREHGSPRRYRSCCAGPRLWCVKLCTRKKKCVKRVLGKPTKRLYERIKRSKECERFDETVAGVSTAPNQESTDLRGVRERSKRIREQDEEAEAYDREIKDDRKRRKERRKREKKEKERSERERKKREREERRRERREERMYPVDVRDDHLVFERQQQPPPPPPSLTDLTKTCCYLCVQNTLAIAAAASKPEQSDQAVQVSAHKFRPATLDRSCSPMTLLLVRTVKVRTRETSTLCPGVGNKETETLEAKRRRKFSLLPGLTRTKCPAGRHAACETDKTPPAARYDNAEKREQRDKKCCREKDV